MVDSDEEQLEQLKNWWAANGTPLVVTVLLLLGGVFGYRAWEANVRETGESASAVYEDLVAAVDNINTDEEAMRTTANSLHEELKNDYGDSAYAVFAALHMAKLAVDADDLSAARKELEWALEKVRDRNIETLIRMRLARLLVVEEDASAAMTLITGFEPASGQLAPFEEIRGDIFRALGDMKSAREAYQRAIDNLDEDVANPVLKLKLADIPVNEDASQSASQDAGEDIGQEKKDT